MFDKIQMKLEVMQTWAELARDANDKAEYIANDLKDSKDYLAEEEAKPDEERTQWRIEDYKNRIAQYERKLKAIKQVQEQIFKIMG